MFTLQQVQEAFDSTYPTKSAYHKLTFKPMLQRLGVRGDADPEFLQQQIRDRLGWRNTADYMFGERGEKDMPEFRQHRLEACQVILEVLNAQHPRGS